VTGRLLAHAAVRLAFVAGVSARLAWYSQDREAAKPGMLLLAVAALLIALLLFQPAAYPRARRSRHAAASWWRGRHVVASRLGPTSPGRGATHNVTGRGAR
jgi:hypothetical protein